VSPIQNRSGGALALLWLALLSLIAPPRAVLANDPPQTRLTQVAGDEECSACHKEQAVGYSHTQHRLTSQLPSAASILGPLHEGSNLLTIAKPAPAIGDPGVAYKIESRGEGFFVTAITGFTNNENLRSESIDVVIGSGVRGQSYLYWRGDALYELPISYWAEGGQWINSPGYKNGPPNFDRPVSPRCLECHVTSIQALSTDPGTNRFDRASLVPGISCQRCHGPGLEHIALEKAKASKAVATATTAILNPARFSRDRQIDLCALCHSGAGAQTMEPSFSYLPGEPLDRYLRANPGEAASTPDVHANQVGLLKKSKCYLASPGMSCTTCHDLHAPERPAASYSTRCLGCHVAKSCGVERTLGPKIAKNCIDCHMPVQQTDAIVSETGDKLIRTSMRTHWIKVYRNDRVR
jgi:hypothetical protein